MITDLVGKVKDAAANLPANPSFNDMLPLLDLAQKYGPQAVTILAEILPGNPWITALVQLGPMLLPMLQEFLPVLQALAAKNQPKTDPNATGT